MNRPTKPKTATLTLKATPEMVRRIDSAAGEARRSRADWIRLAIERVLDQTKAPAAS